MKLGTRTGCGLVAILVAAPGPAYAYLDPGTGSMILQLLFGGAAGALVIWKLYWGKLKERFSSASKRFSSASKKRVIREQSSTPGEE